MPSHKERPVPTQHQSTRRVPLADAVFSTVTASSCYLCPMCSAAAEVEEAPGLSPTPPPPAHKNFAGRHVRPLVLLLQQIRLHWVLRAPQLRAANGAGGNQVGCRHPAVRQQVPFVRAKLLRLHGNKPLHSMRPRLCGRCYQAVRASKGAGRHQGALRAAGRACQLVPAGRLLSPLCMCQVQFSM